MSVTEQNDLTINYPSITKRPQLFSFASIIESTESSTLNPTHTFKIAKLTVHGDPGISYSLTMPSRMMLINKAKASMINIKTSEDQIPDIEITKSSEQVIQLYGSLALTPFAANGRYTSNTFEIILNYN